MSKEILPEILLDEERGFDRGIDFDKIKPLLLAELYKQYEIYKNSNFKTRAYRSLIFLLIELIQLRNGSRITEAINAFKLFISNGVTDKVRVKICKTGAAKKGWVLNKETNVKELKPVATQIRTRQMSFPSSWINNIDMQSLLKDLASEENDLINHNGLQVLICKYMTRKFNCNTHSLRYAFINYMVYKNKKPIEIIAKFVGHKDTKQIITYTQRKHVNDIFDDECLL